MRLISHRGNVFGPDPKNENNPDRINTLLNSGLDCEIDLWKVNNEFYLGHHEPHYKVGRNFLCKSNLWIHAKNFDALHALPSDAKFFWHQGDDFTLTSNGLIWTFPSKAVGEKSIIVDNNRNWREKNYNCFAVCTDYVFT
jgi:hypothetical protein|tara:strand:- start:757 stop:1176 length:420 start_codon:yes stop_codon:yes gene_type:complete